MIKLAAFYRRFTQQQHGYALVVTVMLFTAFAAAAVAYLDRNTVQQKIDRAAAARAQLARLSNAIVEYYYFNPTQYRYPCPAQYSVAVGNSAFGNELTGCQSGTPAGIDILTGGEVIRGMVPVRALAPYGIDATDAFDPWGDRIMYVVNRQLTTNGSGTATQYPTVKDITTNTTLQSPDFLLVSYGPDRVGGIMKSQTSVLSAFSCSASTTREENCNGDLNFDTASANTPTTAVAGNYFDDIVSTMSHLSIPYQACANGATNPPTCDTCSDGYTLTRTETGACSTYYNNNNYTGTYSQGQTRTNCSASWTNSGSPDTSGCVLTSCTNGATNYPTCTYPYTCTDTYCVNGTCDPPVTIQSNTDITGTTGNPNGSTGGDIYSCNGSTSGYCANSPGTCTAGTATGFANNYTGTNCGGTATWTCSHVGSGSDANCSADNTPCTTCSNTALSGYDSGTGWHGPVQTPTLNVCNNGVTTGTVFAVTTDTAGSSWHAETHVWTLTQGVSTNMTYTPYDSKSKSTIEQIVYDGSCSVYGMATFTRNHGSDYQWVRIQLTAINTCISSPVNGGGGGGGCFLGDVMVTLADGSSKPISWLQAGDAVLGRDHAVNHVLSLPTLQTAQTLYGFNGGPAMVTGGHPFWTKDGWKAIDPRLTPVEKHGVKTKQLKVGDALFLDNGRKLTVRSIDPYRSEKLHEVYNPMVDGNNTYYADHMLVHNKVVGCFLGDARVLMADGTTKPIAQLKKGELVQGPHGVNRVLFPETHRSSETLYGFNGGKAFVTVEHMLMTTKGWRSIDPAQSVRESHGMYHPDKLEVGDILLLHGGKTLLVKSIDPHHSGRTVTLYNPALDGDHMYYVNGIQVHNLKMIQNGLN